MILIIISAFLVCAVSGIGSLKYMERQERNVLRLLDDIEMERAKKSRCEKLRSLKNEREELLLQRELYNRLASLNYINEYTTKSEKNLKKAIAIHKNIATIDRKITQINNKINSLD